MRRLELSDIQGLLTKGYTGLAGAAYFRVEIQNAPDARAWLRAQLAARAIDSAARVEKHVTSNLSIAFTARGLEKLGLGEDTLRTFVPELREGMHPAERARLLGDVGANNPEQWWWGHADDPIDMLVIAFAHGATEPAITETEAALKQFGLVAKILGKADDHEPFGFRDGISNPHVEGLSRGAPPARAREIRAGEFVLGYPNEAGYLPASPSVAADATGRLPRLPNGRFDLGRNGTFLVLRQIEQDVDAFRAFANGRERLAAQLVGRWPSGAPVTRYPDCDPGFGHADNDFGYREDRHGLRCPIGAHVRRSNPRDSLSVHDVTPDAALALADQHRILRRGRVYEEGGKRGLVFVCLNANIEKQFEFVQASWVANPEFDGLDGERDALLGPGGQFTRPGAVLPERVRGLAQFTTLRGGAYFFMPGLRSLEFLAASGAP
jgi:Dyp-type peroxidase family